MTRSIIPSQGCALAGMVHLPPLPGSPLWGGSMADLRSRVKKDALALMNGGCHLLVVENMGDLPYVKGEISPEAFAAMTLAVDQVMTLGLPVGIQVLAAANDQALAMASVTGADFIRVEGFAYAHVADEGWIDACAGPLLRRRRELGVDVKVWADIQKKHASHAITGDLSIQALAKGSAFCGADALIITGPTTGAAPPIQNVVDAAIANLPVIIGSGVTPSNAYELAQQANVLIVGSWLKEDGQWQNPVDSQRVKQIRRAMDRPPSPLG